MTPPLVVVLDISRESHEEIVDTMDDLNHAIKRYGGDPDSYAIYQKAPRVTLVQLLKQIGTKDDEVCGSYGLWEMNSDECSAFNGNCTLCKVTKAITLAVDGA